MSRYYRLEDADPDPVEIPERDRIHAAECGCGWSASACELFR